jgi:hypothetical protein
MARYEAAIELANLAQTGLVTAATENVGWTPEEGAGRSLRECRLRFRLRGDVPLRVIDTEYALSIEREAPLGVPVAR